MNRFALAALAVVASSGLVAAGPIPTWGYKVFTEFAPNPIVGEGYGRAATDTVVISAADIEASLKGHVGDPSPLDSIQGGTTFQQTIRGRLGVMFINGMPDYYDTPDHPVYGRTFDQIDWALTREWTKADDTWQVAAESYNGGGAWFGDNYSGYFDPIDQRGVWVRYDARLNADGSLTLNMTPDVPTNPRFVPEPGTLAIVGISAAGMLAAGWRKRFGVKAATPAG